MQQDFSRVNDIQDFASIPPGEYDCRITEVRRGATRDGSERWALRLEVVAGDHAGRTAAWDALVWSERGLPRVKYVLDCLGFDTGGHLSLEPADLVGLELRASLVLEEREDPLTGRWIARLRVPYEGYRQRATSEEEEGSPF